MSPIALPRAHLCPPILSTVMPCKPMLSTRTKPLHKPWLILLPSVTRNSHHLQNYILTVGQKPDNEALASCTFLRTRKRDKSRYRTWRRRGKRPNALGESAKI